MPKLYKTEQKDRIEILKNKNPEYDNENKIYWLDFKGRVAHPSVKNFQLVRKGFEDQVVLQFGKVQDGFYHMDYSWPLTAVQAMGICLSSLDHKLACD